MHDRATRKAFILSAFAFFGTAAIVFTFIGIERSLGANAAIVVALLIVSMGGAYVLEVPRVAPREASVRKNWEMWRADRRLDVAGSELRDLGLVVPTVRIDDSKHSQVERDRIIYGEMGLDAGKTHALAARKRMIADTNDGHLILRKPQLALNAPAVGRRTDHAAILAMRQALGHRPNVLTANVLLVDPVAKMIGLHKRSSSNETEQDRLHVVGGAFDPDRDESLYMTAERETQEETGYKVTTDGCIAILQHEILHNYTMVTFLGVAAARSQPTSRREGDLLWFGLDQLPQIMNGSEHEWVCTGKQAVLVWLAIGAPVGGLDSPIGSRQSRRLFESCAPAAPEA